LKKIKNNALGYFLVYLLNPFLAFIIAFNEFKKNKNHIIIILFYVFYGLLFVVNDQNDYDANRLANMFHNTYEMNFQTFLYRSFIYDANGDSATDLLLQSVLFISSRFSNSEPFFFAVLSLVYALVFVALLKSIHKHLKFNVNTNVYFIFLFLLIPVFEINRFRFFIAIIVYTIFVLRYLEYKNLKYLFYSGASILCHFSFIAPVCILLLYHFIGNRNKLLLALFLISPFISNFVSNDIVNEFSQMLGGNVEAKLDLYTKDFSEFELDEIVNYVQETRWIIKIQYDLLFYTFMSAIVFLNLKRLKLNELSSNLYSFILLFATYVNFIRNLPESFRFIIIITLFGTIYLLLFFSYMNEKKLSITTWLLLVPIVIYSLIKIRSGMETFSIDLLLSNPIIYGFYHSNIPITKLLGK
jgi:hypothetical protein